MLVAAAGAPAATSPQRALARALGKQARAAGRDDGAYVVDLSTGQVLYSLRSTTGRLPASLEKLYTTSTALLRFGPQATLSTAILGTGYADSAGTWHGTLYLKGGGDPTFGLAAFDRFNYGGLGATIGQLVAGLVRTSAIRALQGQITADGSHFDGLRGTPATGYAPSVEVEGLLDGVAFDRGWANNIGTAYQAHPTRFSGQQLALALRAAGVKVPRSTPVSTGIAPGSAQQLAVLPSPPMSALVKLTNTPSDNYFAETLLKDIGASFGGAGTTAAGAAVVRSELASRFGIYPRLNDGSGLSYYDSTSPLQVVTLLERMASDPVFTSSLAVVGKTGTLASIDQGTRAHGRCLGKTGTLAAVANVAGYCQARDGHRLAFAFLVNGNSSTDYVHSVIEGKVLTALANYDG
jgi:D-alanyl-D-alanine carboxypeptidase/D-alanyl-D-alanine-endopeptidase (penicillin-binding protein 4)